MSEHVGEIVAISVAGGLGAVAFIWIAIWNWQEKQRAKFIPQPIPAGKPLPTASKLTRNDVLRIKAENIQKKIEEINKFDRMLTYDQIPLHRQMTIRTNWGLVEQDVIVRKKELVQGQNQIVSTLLTVESAKTPGTRLLSPLLTDSNTRMVQNTTFSIKFS